ncbi:MAG: acetoin utilization protein AcuC [Gammaproteobacteria bacterium]|nr:MAG: acetoin utilization protein AcuC [Gammaproteobacteria bacterium]
MGVQSTAVFLGEALASYGFGDDHPFGPDRMYAFESRYREMGLDQRVLEKQPAIASREEIERFHTQAYIDDVIRKSESGSGFLDYGDTPAFKGVYKAAATVVGTGLTAMRGIMTGEYKRAFVPIAGLHHARRNMAAGFCALNDCGVIIESLFEEYALQRVAYVDIDAHHGDGVFYAFESDPRLLFADIHEDGRFLYPGTGHIEETGSGDAKGLKLNLPAPPMAKDDVFHAFWQKIENFLHQHKPQFILLQAGADSVAGDPITHLQFSPDAHGHAAGRLCAIAERYCDGKLLAMGGGGYNRDNLAAAWTAVVSAFVECG